MMFAGHCKNFHGFLAEVFSSMPALASALFPYLSFFVVLPFGSANCSLSPYYMQSRQNHLECTRLSQDTGK